MSNGYARKSSTRFPGWRADQRVHIEPGEPNQNPYIERFNRIFRSAVLDACLPNPID